MATDYEKLTIGELEEKLSELREERIVIGEILERKILDSGRVSPPNIRRLRVLKNPEIAGLVYIVGDIIEPNAQEAVALLENFPDCFEREA